MEERKNILDYMEQVFVIFGVTIILISIIGIAVGDDAKDYSSMFVLGSEGIPLNTIFQYLLSSVCITALRFVFFSDTLFKKVTTVKRMIGLMVSVIMLIGLFIYVFSWFPVNEVKCWIIFLVCFVICSTISTVVSILKERLENEKLADGLKHLKEDNYNDHVC